ncbi:MAG: bifunctional UDP-N-acetylglucosamine diphosphorylase/glucosamine-1-phosphate N-acetyltransferase GlmU [Elusimicrobiota bacterium]|jgi:bifunctional UDP-N-acetylglucosamine pyrophosphorylase/glucosamine-1-phosphate N-acetyltransferase
MTNTKAQSLGVLILAAGQGTRMVSDLPKVLHPIGGRPMIAYLLRLANALKPAGIAMVVGHGEEQVRKAVADGAKAWGLSRPVTFIRQKQQNGSGAAVVESLPFIKKYQTALVMCGDSPLLTFDTVYALVNNHARDKAQVTLLTARMPSPKGYGRIVRTPMGEVLRIVEESHLAGKETLINEVNSGTYCFETGLLVDALKELKPQGPKGERYLTDALESMRRKGGRVLAHVTANPDEVLGINTRLQLAQAERVVNRRTVDRLMLSGVTVTDPAHVYVDADVEVGQDTLILPGTVLRGKTRIGRQCRIGPFSLLEDAAIGNESSVAFSQVVSARVLEKCSIGPFSNIRPDSVIGPRAKVGNFSEIKNAKIGFGSKVPHLSYVGDAELAEDVNIGAGTITCNYDGVEKHKTIIGAKAFIGSNVNLVAPVRIGRGAKVGAGSTITEDVPEGALALARAQQVNKMRKPGA